MEGISGGEGVDWTNNSQVIGLVIGPLFHEDQVVTSDWLDMFLYWKKRGAYELESSPSPLSHMGIERYSSSSSLDVIRDLSGKLMTEPDQARSCWFTSGFGTTKTIGRVMDGFACLAILKDLLPFSRKTHWEMLWRVYRQNKWETSFYWPSFSKFWI